VSSTRVGSSSARPEIVEVVSQGCHLASVYWSVNADVTFTYAEDGVTVACFDPLLIEHPWLGANPESIRERAHGLRFGVERARSDSLALVERLTGVRLDRARLEKPHRCVDAPGDLVATMPSVQEYSGSEARLSGSGGVDSTRRQVALVGVVLPEQAKRRVQSPHPSPRFLKLVVCTLVVCARTPPPFAVAVKFRWHYMDARGVNEGSVLRVLVAPSVALAPAIATANAQNCSTSRFLRWAGLDSNQRPWD
jgi:hypothetical protein